MKIVIDLDNTILDTSNTIINLYNKINDKDIQINYNELCWDFEPYITKEELPSLLKLFDDERLNDEYFVFPNAIETINEWCKNNEVVICSKPSEKREQHTMNWIKKLLPNVSIMFTDTFNKSQIGKVDIVIDDRIDALNSIDSKYKIVYGCYNWNKHYISLLRVKDWNELKDLINLIINGRKN